MIQLVLASNEEVFESPGSIGTANRFISAVQSFEVAKSVSGLVESINCDPALVRRQNPRKRRNKGIRGSLQSIENVRRVCERLKIGLKKRKEIRMIS